MKNILISIIESIDRYNFLLKDHHRRTATIAYQLASSYGLNTEQISTLVLSASIHDIGALHIQERDKLLYIDVEDPEAHEILGENILMGFKPFNNIGRVIRHHHIVYDDCQSGKYKLDDIPFECFFLHLADRIDVLMATQSQSNNPKQSVIDEINKRFGNVFMPELKETFNILTSTDEFWENIDNDSFHELLFMSLESDMIDIDSDDLEGLASLFARVVDYKSKWTSYHSKSVSFIAYRTAQLMGLSDDICFELKIAGYLHDLGKIAVPTEILEKPSYLDKREMSLMKTHVNYTSLILSRIEGLGSIAKWAASHHEKRDRTGYPLKRSANDFTIEMDILAFSDIISALAEDRPYRAALSQEHIIEILKTFVPDQLDETVLKVIIENFDELYSINKNIASEFNHNTK